MPNDEKNFESNGSLPSPVDRPGADAVIFDGNCKICRAQVARLARWDGAGRLCYLSLHDEQVAEDFPDLSHDELMSQMYVVAWRDGLWTQRFGGARAIRYLSRRLPRLWFAAPALHFPFSLPLWNAVYRWIANRRYRLSGSDPANECEDACSIHARKSASTRI